MPVSFGLRHRAQLTWKVQPRCLTLVWPLVFCVHFLFCRPVSCRLDDDVKGTASPPDLLALQYGNYVLQAVLVRGRSKDTLKICSDVLLCDVVALRHDRCARVLVGRCVFILGRANTTELRELWSAMCASVASLANERNQHIKVMKSFRQLMLRRNCVVVWRFTTEHVSQSKIRLKSRVGSVRPSSAQMRLLPISCVVLAQWHAMSIMSLSHVAL